MHLVFIVAYVFGKAVMDWVEIVIQKDSRLCSSYGLSRNSDSKRLKAAETKDVHECKREEKKIKLKLSEAFFKKWFLEAQLVKLLTSAQVMILHFHEIQPHMGLCADSMEPSWDSPSFLCASPGHTLSLSK